MPTVNIPIQPADPFDVKETKTSLKRGKMYFLKSETEETFDGPYFISDDTDKKEFVHWFKLGRVYVAQSPLDNTVTLINS